MNAAVAFTEEILSALLSIADEQNKKISKMNEQNEQILDFVQLLLLSDDENKHTLLDIQKSATNIESKIDSVLEKLTVLENDFADLKAERRDIEQKIILMISKLQKLEESISDEDLKDYHELARNLYINWDALDELTKRFIPLAEYLYSKLQKYDKADYSPVILELCRAIENEFLLKIFRKYTLDLIKRKGKGLTGFLKTDRSDKNLTKKTKEFTNAVSKAAQTGKPKYTLGQMNTILSMLKEDYTVAASPLLQDFAKYLNYNTEAAMLLDSDYIKKINDIVNNFRNPSAHPDFMNIQKADECREVMPDRIDYLMDCVC